MARAGEWSLAGQNQSFDTAGRIVDNPMVQYRREQLKKPYRG